MVILDYSCACQQWKNKANGTKEILKPAVSGEKKGPKELRVSAKPCAEKFITVDECITTDRNSAGLLCNTRKGALETRFYQVRAPISERKELEGFPTPKRQI